MNKEKISYAELAKRVGDMLLCNSITSVDEGLYERLENGKVEYCYKHENEEECATKGDECDFESFDIYQYYLIDESGADYLKRHTSEIVFYVEPLDLYVWGITHFGTSWNGVLTEITA